MVRLNNFSGNKLVNNDFGIQVGGGLATVEARVLLSPMVFGSVCLFVLLI
jgi:hypothetical protein